MDIKKIFFFLGIVILTLFSCNSTKSTLDSITSLEGNWQLDYITGPRIPFQALYPDSKPTLYFDLNGNHFSGNSSCNQYKGKLKVFHNTISFKEPIVATKRMCPNMQGETTYMTMLNKVETFTISKDGQTLNFLIGKVVLMRFIKI